ncbi:hypothetical protein K0M31_007842 [Melipona bicolor]|uniref:Uncharacterized protein n=1 Tax=Melipona bicolor TaxID=60889 RepID=A0AA40GCG0_9HYME|nr:hypothetical protein K0M31_007842 [Melipona bicolor]
MEVRQKLTEDSNRLDTGLTLVSLYKKKEILWDSDCHQKNRRNYAWRAQENDGHYPFFVLEQYTEIEFPNTFFKIAVFLCKKFAEGLESLSEFVKFDSRKRAEPIPMEDENSLSRAVPSISYFSIFQSEQTPVEERTNDFQRGGGTERERVLQLNDILSNSDIGCYSRLLVQFRRTGRPRQTEFSAFGICSRTEAIGKNEVASDLENESEMFN